MTDHSREEAARLAGATPETVDRLVEAEMLRPGPDGRFSPGDVRRLQLVPTLTSAGFPLETLAEAKRQGAFNLDFLDAPVYERMSTYAAETFAEVSARTEVPVELLMLIREAAGSAAPHPDDVMREMELVSVPWLEMQVAAGFRPQAIERYLRAQGESLRRIAETEAEWWRTEIIEPRLADFQSPDQIAASEFSTQLAAATETSMLALFHQQQAHAWTTNIIGGLEEMLDRAGLRSRVDRPPAMCFLDITGYTRLTQERGDADAAAVAANLSRLVQRTSVQHRGKPVKWLGDGVMFYFPEPAPGVVAALEMVAGVVAAGLPPARVGLHAGPVLFQAGDYYGQTVNLAARIADYARPGEVLVSRAVVEAAEVAEEGRAAFAEIGPVELKGVSGTVELFSARLA